MSVQTGQGTDNQGVSGAAGTGQQASGTGESSLGSAFDSGTVGASSGGQASGAEPSKQGDGASGAGQQGAAQDPAKLGPWGDQLPKEIRENPDAVKALSKFGGFGDLTKSYLELSEKLGTSITMPGKDASQEELEAFYTRLGRPEKAEMYSFKQDDEGSKAFAAAAFKAGMSDQMASRMHQWVAEFGKAALQQQQERVQAQLAETDRQLKAEFKEKFPEKVQYFKRALDAFGGDELKGLLKKTGLAYDPTIVRTFISIGERIGEPGTGGKGGGAAQPIKSLNEGGSLYS